MLFFTWRGGGGRGPSAAGCGLSRYRTFFLRDAIDARPTRSVPGGRSLSSIGRKSFVRILRALSRDPINQVRWIMRSAPSLCTHGVASLYLPVADARAELLLTADRISVTFVCVKRSVRRIRRRSATFVKPRGGSERLILNLPKGSEAKYLSPENKSQVKMVTFYYSNS